MKFYFWKNLSNPLTLLLSFFSFISLNCDYIKSDYLFDDSQIDSSTKTEEDNSIIPTNPFEIVEMMRRYNSLNDATSPSDALDEALKSFNSLEEN